MANLRFPRGAVVLLALFGCLSWSAGRVMADDAADLDRAIGLFKQGDYLSAQELLVGIDRSKLDSDRQELRDDYLNRAQTAITLGEKALRDLEDAETAIADNEVEQARRLLESVLSNEYASDVLRRSAQAYQRDLPPASPRRDSISQKDEHSEPLSAVSVLPSTEDGNKVNGQRVRVLTEQGDEMARAARYDEARRLYEQALEALPGYPEAVDGLQRVREHERTLAGTRAESLIDRIRRDNQINWQRTVTLYRDLEQTIRTYVAEIRFDDAGPLVIRSRQVVEAGKQFADPITKYESLRNELEALEAFVAEAERAYNMRTVAETRRKVQALRDTRLRETQQRRAEQIEALMNQAEQHRKDGDLDAAIQVLRQAIIIDPRYRPARWRMDTFEDLRQYQVARRVRNDFYEQTRQSLNSVEEAKIPWAEEVPRYPADWLELIARPERRIPTQGRARSRLFGALDRRIPVDFRQNPFDGVLEALAEAGQLNIIVNWNDLEHAGIERRVLIDLDLPREIMLKLALTEVLEQAGGGLVELGYDVVGDYIKIATRRTLDKKTYTAVYDINDLLMEIPMFNDAPTTDLARTHGPAWGNRRRQQEDRPWAYGDDDDDEPEVAPGRENRVQRILNLIRDSVAPDSWHGNGGTVGRLQEFNGQLVVTQNSVAHRDVANLLGKLREQRAVQIAVEARFITVTSNYLEEMGLDIDIVLNSGNAGFDFAPGGSGALTDPVLGNALLIPRSFTRLGFSPASPGGLGTALAVNTSVSPIPQPFGDVGFVPQRGSGGGSRVTPVPLINQVTSFTDPASLGSDIPGSFAGNSIGPAFSLFGSFLDNIQVDFLIRATQADSRSTVLTAPRLVLFNGQRSWVAVTIQQNFISELTPVVATGAVAQAPTTDTINAGAVLDVNATVSANKRYVVMTLRPGITRLLALQTIPFSGGGAGGGFGGGTALNAFVQLPTLSSQRLQTTVSVPDGGTLLIGGQKLATDVEIEAGVPILSKIPILKRLYSSRSLIKDEQTLLILVKPRILIQTEQEELAFPTFSGR